ncbi:MAG: hypothetical protein L3J71_02990 [Victivallaceae bacterium]|nr:hypothetical protein [Victivallaceae bacterium]
MFTKSLTTVLIAGITALTANAADNELSQKAAWKGTFKEVTAGQHSGEKCFETTGYSQIVSKKSYKIDPAKTYVLSGWFKSVGKQPGRLYFGFMPLNKKNRAISSPSVMVEANTDTVLAEDCRPEDKVIKIKNGAKWKVLRYGLIAFKTDPTGEYSDIPNQNITPFGITSVEQQGDIWAVTLKNPCGKAFPEGTPVRQHRSGSSYQYCAAGSKKVPTEWTKYSATLKGIAVINMPNNEFWPGTEFVKILMLINYQAKAGEVMLWDDIKLEEK